MANKEHLTEGLIKIVSRKSKMNGNGLSDKLKKKEFPKLVPVIRPARQEGRSLGSATTVEIYIYNPS